MQPNRLDNKITEELNEYVDALNSRKSFSGVLLVAQGNVPILNFVNGYANRGKKIKNTLNTKFNLGSINKIFTAVAIGQLIDKDQLSLHDNVGKYLKDYPNRRVRDFVV